MFKKSLAAVAVLSAFGASAMAANVSVYGVVDTAVLYNHVRTTDDGAKSSEHSFTMESGINSPSRFGLKGIEDLGNGFKVGFKLENGFNNDDGTMNQGGRLFGREAALSVYSDYGTVSLGRMGGVGSSCGTYDLVYGTADAFDGFDWAIGGLAISDRYDNMITYQSPAIAGLQLTMQHSFNMSGAENAQVSKNNRYSSVALTGEFGSLNTVLAYEFVNRAAENATYRDGHTVYVGANYDCGFAKTFAMAQYFKGADNAIGLSLADEVYDENGDDFVALSKGLTGYGLHLGTIVPVAGGDLTVAAYYADGKLKGFGEVAYDDNGNVEDVYASLEGIGVKYVGVTARYAYPLSKRTSLYAGAGYAQRTIDSNKGFSLSNGYEIEPKEKDKLVQAYVGFTHAF